MKLHNGIAALSLALPEGAEQKLTDYLALLAKWNRTYNLTAIHDLDQMISSHLLDSLAILPWLEEVRSLADVGSGAGLPAIPLAICRTDLLVTSIEANQKKAAFQQQAKIELVLPNVSIYCQRVEDIGGTFDVVVSRAFADLADFVKMAGHLARRLFAMKGVYPSAEIDRLPANWRVVESIKLTIPGLNAERHLIVLGRN
jgi:16S rRNA (guanine527-N7)-methyltransferase